MNSSDPEHTALTLAENTALQSPLLVQGGSVFLPGKKRCRIGDPDFNEQLSAILPDDIGPVLLQQLAHKRQRTHPLFIPALLLFFALCLFFMYSFFPRQLPTTQGRAFIPAPAYVAPQNKEFYEIFKKAEKAYRQQAFQESHQLLLPLLKQLEQQIPLSEATSLLYYYFNSLHEGLFSPIDLGRARGLLSQLCARDPEQILWKIYYVAFTAPDLNYQQTLRELNEGRLEQTWEIRLLHMKKLMSYLDQATLINQKKRTKDKNPQLQYEIVLDLLKSKVLVNRWLLEGGKGKSKLPDDLRNPGVEFREQAYQIASQHKYHQHLEFLQIRHFIVLTLKNQHRFANPFFFNGREHILADALNQELESLTLQMQRTEK
ncbi:MAG: hypothetical protein WCT05_06350 [Lentisphaeria bacterium]